MWYSHAWWCPGTVWGLEFWQTWAPNLGFLLSSWLSLHSYMKEEAHLLPKRVLGLNEISIWHVESPEADSLVLNLL